MAMEVYGLFGIHLLNESSALGVYLRFSCVAISVLDVISYLGLWLKCIFLTH